MLQKQLRKFLVFKAKRCLLTAKSETNFQIFYSDDISLRDETRQRHSLDLDQENW